MRTHFQTFILCVWRQLVLLQQCQLLRARGFRVRRRGQFLLIAGGKRHQRPSLQRQMSTPQKCRPGTTTMRPQTSPVASEGSARKIRPLH